MPIGTPTHLETEQELADHAATLGYSLVPRSKFTGLMEKVAVNMENMKQNQSKGAKVTHALLPLKDYTPNLGQEKMLCGLLGVRIALCRMFPGQAHLLPSRAKAAAARESKKKEKAAEKEVKNRLKREADYRASRQERLTVPGHRPPTIPPGLPFTDLGSMANHLHDLLTATTKGPWSMHPDLGLVALRPEEAPAQLLVGTDADYQAIMFLKNMGWFFHSLLSYYQANLDGPNQLGTLTVLQLEESLQNLPRLTSTPSTEPISPEPCPLWAEKQGEDQSTASTGTSADKSPS